HSIIWQMDAAGHTTQISPNEAAFHPVTLTSALAWVQVPPAALLTPTRDSDVSLPDQEREVLHGLSGALLVRDFAGGQERTLGDDVAVSGLAASGDTLLWQSGARFFVARGSAGAVADLAQMLHAASAVGVTNSALVWWLGDAETLYVYTTV